MHTMLRRPLLTVPPTRLSLCVAVLFVSPCVPLLLFLSLVLSSSIRPVLRRMVYRTFMRSTSHHTTPTSQPHTDSFTHTHMPNKNMHTHTQYGSLSFLSLQAGWPTMSLFAGLSFIALGIYYGRQRGGDDWRGSGSMLPGSFIILNVINAIIGVFLIFGPGEVKETFQQHNNTRACDIQTPPLTHILPSPSLPLPPL